MDIETKIKEMREQRARRLKALLMRDVGKKKLREIAEAMGVSIERARQMIEQARQEAQPPVPRETTWRDVLELDADDLRLSTAENHYREISERARQDGNLELLARLTTAWDQAQRELGNPP